MSPGEKSARCFELSERAAKDARQAVRDRFPLAGEREVFLGYARTKLGDDLFQRAYGNALPPDLPGAPLAFDLESIGDEITRLAMHELVAESRRAE